MFIPYCVYVSLLIYLSVTFNGDFLESIYKKMQERETQDDEGHKKKLDYDAIAANVEGKGQILALLMTCFCLWIYFARVECG